jgi:cytoskeletal protein RodZ
MVSEHVKFKTPGHLIRQAREAQDISLKDLAGDTRIPVNLLEAIENDNYDQLSGSVYVRSFLKTCAQQLGLDATVLITHFERMVAEDSTPEVPPEQTWQTESKVERISTFPSIKFNSYYGYAIAGVVLLLLLFVFWPDGNKEDAIIPVQAEVAVEEMSVEEQQPVTTQSEPEVVVEKPVLDDLLELLPVPNSNLEFADGKTWPLVLRLVFNEKSDVEVGIDTGSSATKLNWDDRVRGLPSAGVKAGTLYSFGGKNVFYFGAKDHFLLKFRDKVEVSVTLNGKDIIIPDRVIGRQWVLDSDTVSR